MDIGFVGLGTMGRGIVRNLLRAGHGVTVWNRSRPELPEELAAAKLAGSIADAVAGKSRVFVCVTGPDAQRAVLEGPDGAIAHLAKGAIIADVTTTAPEVAKHMAEAVAAVGATYLDTPVFGSKGEAWEGRLDFVCGGPEAAFKQFRPLLEPLAATIHYMGGSGAGASMKLVGNLLVAAQMELLGEALSVATKAGLDGAAVMGVFDVADYSSLLIRNVGSRHPQPQLRPVVLPQAHAERRASHRRLRQDAERPAAGVLDDRRALPSGAERRIRGVERLSSAQVAVPPVRDCGVTQARRRSRSCPQDHCSAAARLMSGAGDRRAAWVIAIRRCAGGGGLSWPDGMADGRTEIMGNRKMTMGVIVGNRGFFPGVLAKTGREDIIAALARAGMDAVALSPEQSKYGAVETHEEAKRCAELFRANAAKIDGVIVTLPNFGDERAVAETLRLANLGVPALVQASPDAPGKMTQQQRRDSFCGKISVCNNLRQFGIPFSLTAEHTEALDSELFARRPRAFRGRLPHRQGHEEPEDRLHRRASGRLQHRALQREHSRGERNFRRDGRPFRNLRPHRPPRRRRSGRDGQGRPNSVAMFARQRAGKGAHPHGQARPCHRRLDAPRRRVGERHPVLDLDAGKSGRHALHGDEHDEQRPHVERLRGGHRRNAQHARAGAGRPRARARCSTGTTTTATTPTRPSASTASNLPKSFFAEARMHHGEIFAATVGEENAQGTMAGLIKASAMTFARISTDDLSGNIRGYVGQGRFTSDALETFGGAGVVEIPGLQALMRFICENGFEHHVAANMSNVAEAVHEAGSKYLGWEMTLHSGA